MFPTKGPAEKDLASAQLVQILHRLLADERSAPEIKYNSMVLICALMGSGKASSCRSVSMWLSSDVKRMVIINDINK